MRLHASLLYEMGCPPQFHLPPQTFHVADLELHHRALPCAFNQGVGLRPFPWCHILQFPFGLLSGNLYHLLPPSSFSHSTL